MGGKKPKKKAKAPAKKSKPVSHSEKKEARLLAPPQWFLYAIIVLNIFGLWADYLIISNHWYAQTLADVQLIITPLWLGLCALMVIYLLRKNSVGKAYLLPVYYLVFFAIMYGIAKYIEFAQLAIDSETLFSIIYVIIGVSTVFEVSASIYFLRVKK